MLCKLITLLLTVAFVKSQNKVASWPQWTDWRLTNTISEVIDQGTCHAGWAIAATTVYEWQIARERGGTNYTDLSDGYVLDCSSQGGCGNGSLLGALNFLISNGTPLQSDFSNNDIYNDRQDTTNCSNSYTMVTTTWVVYVHKHRKISVNKLKKIVSVGPTANEIYADS